MVLEKVKAHSEDKQNERADQIAKKGGKANVLIKIKQVITEKQSEHSTKEFTMRSTRRLYQDIQCRKCKKEKKSFEHLSTCPRNKEAWAKKKEEILDNIKEDLKQKEKIDLGPNGLREVFISRDKEEYRNRYIE
ncbi:1898_t:CDS:2 [Gigaspora margarita]|uniref:1898_t:CDS:1 n=1 Tax=Gigaspora margarita TaxID=4874 RepID=A0ABN7VNN1_GIGMA|nr:1898_t:CDS:2 [Gigaspora margarita]